MSEPRPITVQGELIPLHTYTSKIGEKKDYYEQILLKVEGYPTCLFHVDTLFNKDDKENPLYLSLISGIPHKVQIIFKEVTNEEPGTERSS